MKIVNILLIFICFNYLNLCFLNILQKQYYNLKRLFIYLMQNKYLQYEIVINVFILLTIFLKIKIISFILAFCFYFFIFKDKLIKFKLTKRVIRNILVFNIIIPFLFMFNFYEATLMFYAFFIFSFSLSILIEKMIQNKYIKKAKNKLKTIKPLIIVITGSYGKTTTKNFIYEIINKDYRVCTTKKSYNTLNGILMTINNDLKPFHEILILEIGLDTRNGINKFKKIIDANIGIVTKIGKQHLSTFKSFKNIINEKNKLFDLVKENGYAILNIDDKNINNTNLKVINKTISTNQMANYYIDKIEYNELETKFSLHIGMKEYKCSTFLHGTHNLSNLLLSIAVADILNINHFHIIQKIASLKNVEHRLSYEKKNNWLIIDDSYNSNYEGFLSSCDLLSRMNNYKILISPGLIESTLTNKEKDIMYKKINISCDLFCIIEKNDFFKDYPFENQKRFTNFKDCMEYLNKNYYETNSSVLIENDLPDIFIK